MAALHSQNSIAVGHEEIHTSKAFPCTDRLHVVVNGLAGFGGVELVSGNTRTPRGEVAVLRHPGGPAAELRLEEFLRIVDGRKNIKLDFKDPAAVLCCCFECKPPRAE